MTITSISFNFYYRYLEESIYVYEGISKYNIIKMGSIGTIGVQTSIPNLTNIMVGG